MNQTEIERLAEELWNKLHSVALGTEAMDKEGFFVAIKAGYTAAKEDKGVTEDGKEIGKMIYDHENQTETFIPAKDYPKEDKGVVMNVKQMEKLDSALDARYNEAIKHDAPDWWRKGFESAQGIVLNHHLEQFGYDPKKLETNAVNLIRRLFSENQPLDESQSPSDLYPDLDPDLQNIRPQPLPDATKDGIDWKIMEDEFYQKFVFDSKENTSGKTIYIFPNEVFNFFRSRPEFQLRQGDGITPFVAKQLLLIRTALAKGDTNEAYHNLYLIASPNMDKMSNEVWKEIEFQAAKQSPEYKSRPEL